MITAGLMALLLKAATPISMAMVACSTTSLALSKKGRK